jgi:hypothetical protein
MFLRNAKHVFLRPKYESSAQKRKFQILVVQKTRDIRVSIKCWKLLA